MCDLLVEHPYSQDPVQDQKVQIQQDWAPVLELGRSHVDADCLDCSCLMMMMLHAVEDASAGEDTRAIVHHVHPHFQGPRMISPKRRCVFCCDWVPWRGLCGGWPGGGDIQQG
jgi:hypothetical protein